MDSDRRRACRPAHALDDAEEPVAAQSIARSSSRQRETASDCAMRSSLEGSGRVERVRNASNAASQEDQRGCCIIARHRDIARPACGKLSAAPATNANKLIASHVRIPDALILHGPAIDIGPDNT